MNCLAHATLLLAGLAVTAACGGAATGTGTGAGTGVSASACRSGGSGDTTLVALRDGPEASVPTTREVVAWYRGTADCGPCPPEASCAPCVTKVLFSDTPDAPDADVFWLTCLAADRVFREGCAYALELSLDEGYRQDLYLHDNNPMFFPNGLPAAQIVEVH